MSSDSSPRPSDASRGASPAARMAPSRRRSPRSGVGVAAPAPRSASVPAAGTAPRYPRRERPMGRPAAPDYWRRWRAAHPAYRERERDRTRARRRAGYRSPKTRRPRLVAEPMVVAPHPLMAWAQQLATDLVHEDRRAWLSDELYPDVVGEILMAKLERQDPMARATAWLRAERSWRHHLAPLLEAACGRWLAPASVPAGAARPTKAPAAGPRRTSVAGNAAGGRASPTASAHTRPPNGATY